MWLQEFRDVCLKRESDSHDDEAPREERIAEKADPQPKTLGPSFFHYIHSLPYFLRILRVSNLLSNMFSSLITT